MKQKRKAISARLRFEIFKRDEFTCQYCGATPPGVLLHVDHIHPVAEGGDNSPENLVTACERCNQGKGARLLSNVPKSLQQLAKETEEREAQIAGYAAVMRAKRERVEDDCWEVASVFDANARDGYPRAQFQSIRNFVERLGVTEVLEAAEIAYARYPYRSPRQFKYFCGICWNKIRREGADPE